jgi:hypothetical protein
VKEDKPALVVHGHFYQPPRENPWTEKIERQAGAHPYHDWNERIYHESYRPNAYARISDGAGRIESIVNTYEHLSFDFGPTLMSWLERQHPVAADPAAGGRPPQPADAGRPRQRDRPGLRPRHPPALQRARPPDADPLGHRRLPPPLPPRSRIDVAARDCVSNVAVVGALIGRGESAPSFSRPTRANRIRPLGEYEWDRR